MALTKLGKTKIAQKDKRKYSDQNRKQEKWHLKTGDIAVTKIENKRNCAKRQER